MPGLLPKPSITVSSRVPLQCAPMKLTTSLLTGYFGSGLNRDKTLQEPFLRAHFAAALVEDAGEIHIAESASDGVVGVAVW